MREDDRIRIIHMLDSAKEVIAYAQGQSRSSLDNDRKLVHAIVRCIEIIGEAASRVNNEYQKAYSNIPWAQIISMRNRLIHTYFDVDLDEVWRTVKDDLPPLVDALERIVAKHDDA